MEPDPSASVSGWKIRVKQGLLCLLLLLIVLVIAGAARIVWHMTRPALPLVNYKALFGQLVETTRHELKLPAQGEDAGVLLDQLGATMFGAWDAHRAASEAAFDAMSPDEQASHRLATVDLWTALEHAGPLRAWERLREVNDYLDLIDSTDAPTLLSRVPMSSVQHTVPGTTPMMFAPAKDHRGRVLDAAAYLGLRIRLDAEDGRFGEAPERIRLMIALAQRCEAQCGLTSFMLSAGARSAIAESLRFFAGNQRCDAKALSELGTILAALPELNCTPSIEGERLMALEVIQSMFHGTFSGSTARGSSAPTTSLFFNLMATHGESVDKLNELLDACKEFSRLSPAERRARAAEFKQRARDIPKRFFIVGTVAPDMTSLVLNADSVNCRMRGARIMVALARYRCDHGAYPATLDELTPAYLHETIRDDFAPDGRFCYVRGAVKPDATDAEYLLYSIGYDGRDNGGARSKREFEALSEAGAGTDYVLWPPEGDKASP